jgi:PRTRC genetic system protein B
MSTRQPDNNNDAQNLPALFAPEPAPAGLNWAIPKELEIPADPLRMRVDFFHQATELTYFDNNEMVYRIPVDAEDVAHALNWKRTYNTGFLPDNTLWWSNDGDGPLFAIYVPEGIRKVALQTDIEKPVERFSIPLPPLLFLCRPAQAPWVVAVQKRPTKETDKTFHAPLANVFQNSRTCAGNNTYPERAADIIETFFISFFSEAATLSGRSMRHPKNIIDLWRELDGKKQFPMNDLKDFGTIKDLMKFEVD